MLNIAKVFPSRTTLFALTIPKRESDLYWLLILCARVLCHPATHIKGHQRTIKQSFESIRYDVHLDMNLESRWSLSFQSTKPLNWNHQRARHNFVAGPKSSCALTSAPLSTKARMRLRSPAEHELWVSQQVFTTYNMNEKMVKPIPVPPLNQGYIQYDWTTQ